MSTTGFNKFKDNSLKYAIIFNDPICPNCDNRLTLIHMPLKGKEINIRYECKSCGFICPIGRDGNNPEHEFPLYDNSINNFLKDFEELNKVQKEPKKVKKKVIKGKRKDK